MEKVDSPPDISKTLSNDFSTKMLFTCVLPQTQKSNCYTDVGGLGEFSHGF